MKESATVALFDIDKTLIHRSEAHEMGFSHAFREVYGVDASVDMISYHGKTDPGIAREILLSLGLEGPEIESLMDEFLRRLTDYVRKHIHEDEIRLIDGADEFLNTLKGRGALMGLVTGNLREIACLKLQRVGLDEYFSFGGFGSDSSSREMLAEIALERCPLSRSRTILFGDTPYDIKAGRHIGALTIGMASGSYTREDLIEAGADYVFPDFRDLLLMDVLEF